MLKQTDTVLARADYETRSLTIDGDTSLGAGDIKLIADVIARCPKLESVTIRNCNLTSDEMHSLVRVLIEHPSVTALDLSGNAFTTLDFLIPLAGMQADYNSNSYVGNRRINAVDLSNNSQAFDRKSAKRLLTAIADFDHLAALSLPFDPWDVTGSFDKLLDKAHNLVETGFDIVETTQFVLRADIDAEDKRKYLDDSVAANLEAAQQVLQRVESAQMISVDDVKNLNARFPAVLYLAQKKVGRAKALDMFCKFHERAKTATGLETRIGKYMAASEGGGHLSAPAPTVFAAPEADAGDIEAAVRDLPECSRDGVRRDMLLCRANQAKFMELGGDTLRAMSKVSTISLTVMTALPTMQSPVTLMEKFTGKFASVVKALEQVSGHGLSGSLTAASQEVTKPKGFWATMLEPAEDAPRDLRAVAPLANDAAQTLRNMVPEMQSVADAIATELATTNTVVGAYDAIKERLQLYCEVGRAVMGEWKAEYKDKHPDAPETEVPFYVRSLDDRVKFLWQAHERVAAHSGNHIMHAELLQRQLQHSTMAMEQDLPLLGASVEGFARQLQHSRPGSSEINAAAQGVRAIDKQAESVMNVMRELEKMGEDVRAHIGDLFLDRALVSNPHAAPALAAGRAPAG